MKKLIILSIILLISIRVFSQEPEEYDYPVQFNDIIKIGTEADSIGVMRYNTKSDSIEYWNGSTWIQMGGGIWLKDGADATYNTGRVRNITSNPTSGGWQNIIENTNSTMLYGNTMKLIGGGMGIGIDTTLKVISPSGIVSLWINDVGKVVFPNHAYGDGTYVKNGSVATDTIFAVLALGSPNAPFVEVLGTANTKNVSIGFNNHTQSYTSLGLGTGNYLTTNVHGNSNLSQIYKIGESNVFGNNNLRAKKGDSLWLNRVHILGNTNLAYPTDGADKDTLYYSNVLIHGDSSGAALPDSSMRIGMFGSGLYDVYDLPYVGTDPITDKLVWGFRKFGVATRTDQMEGTVHLSNVTGEDSYFDIRVDEIRQNGTPVTFGSLWAEDTDTIYSTDHVAIGISDPYSAATQFTVSGNSHFDGDFHLTGYLTGDNIYATPDTTGHTGGYLAVQAGGGLDWDEIIPVSAGGTGSTTLTDSRILIGNGTSAVEASSFFKIDGDSLTALGDVYIAESLDWNNLPDTKGSGVVAHGEKIYKPAGEAINAGKLVYIKHNSDSLFLVDANLATTIEASLYFSCDTLAKGGHGDFMKRGYVTIATDVRAGGFSAGALYATETAGGIADTLPTTLGALIRCIGFAENDSTFFFNPSMEFFEIGEPE